MHNQQFNRARKYTGADVVQCEIAPRPPSELTSGGPQSEAGLLLSHIKTHCTIVRDLFLSCKLTMLSLNSNRTRARLAARGMKFSLQPQRLLKTHSRQWVSDGQIIRLVQRNSRKNSTITNRSTTRESIKIGNIPINKPPKARQPNAAGFGKQVVELFRYAQKRRPYFFQFCTSLWIWFSADLMAQQIGDIEYDVAQTGRMLIIGGSASIPMYRW